MTGLSALNLSEGSGLMRYGDSTTIAVPRISAAVDNYFKLIIPATDTLKTLA